MLREHVGVRPVQPARTRLARPLAFTASSLACTGLDWVGVLALHAAIGNLALAVAGARAVSASTNFLLNHWLFQGTVRQKCQPGLRRRPLAGEEARAPEQPGLQRRARRLGEKEERIGEAVRYAALACVLAGASYVGLRVVTALGVALALAKPLVDGSLFLASYAAQRFLVFRTGERPAVA